MWDVLSISLMPISVRARSPPSFPSLCCRHEGKQVVYRFFVAAADGATPRRLHMHGNDLISGAHFDEWCAALERLLLLLLLLLRTAQSWVWTPHAYLYRCFKNSIFLIYFRLLFVRLFLCLPLMKLGVTLLLMLLLTF